VWHYWIKWIVNVTYFSLSSRLALYFPKTISSNVRFSWISQENYSDAFFSLSCLSNMSSFPCLILHPPTFKKRKKDGRKSHASFFQTEKELCFFFKNLTQNLRRLLICIWFNYFESKTKKSKMGLLIFLGGLRLNFFVSFLRKQLFLR